MCALRTISIAWSRSADASCCIQERQCFRTFILLVYKIAISDSENRSLRRSVVFVADKITTQKGFSIIFIFTLVCMDNT
jgi:hypothetical protein